MLEKAAPAGRSAYELVQPVWCPDPEGSGFLVGWCHLGQVAGPASLERYGPPWAEPGDVELPLESAPSLLRSSPSGRYLATTCAARPGKLQLWDRGAGGVMHEIEPPGYLAWAGFSPDEKFLATLGRGPGTAAEGAVVRVPSGRPVSEFRVEHAQEAAIHPTGVAVVAGGLGQLVFVDLASGQTRQTLFVGARVDRSALYQAFAAQVQQHLAQLDPQALEQQYRSAMEKQVKAMEEAGRRGAVPAGVSVEEMIQRFREQMEKTIAEMKRQHQQRQQAGAEGLFPAQGAERVTTLECGADGRLLCCATDQGVRVYAWDALLSATECTPAPVFAVAPEAIAVEAGGGRATPLRAGPRALAHDAAGNRLLFGGLDGKVGFLDLTTGRAGTLLDPPGRPAILSLGLSRDRRSLCCTYQPEPFAQGNKRKPQRLQVWNYAALNEQLKAG